MKVSLSYGDEHVEIEIPERNLAGIIKPKQINAKSNIAGELDRVLNNPHGPMIEEVARGKSVCVLVEDHTRDEPHKEMIDAVVPRLRDANSVQFIIATGSHVVDHPKNHEIVAMIREAAKMARLDNWRLLIHDCYGENFIDLGKTSRDTPVVVNPAAVGHDAYVVLADMKAHYFAGYSNALKDFLPGICAFQSIEANHSMALDPNSTFGKHPFHPSPERRDNPLADDMREATEIITKDAKVFTLSTVTSGGRLVWADAGRLEPVIAGGIEVLDEIASFIITPVSRIIVTPGGYPQDKSLYHAQRSLELTKNAVSDGGEILFLAECRDGVAPESAIENFYNRLTAPLDTVIESISGQYHLYEHKAFKFAELLKRVSAVKMYTKLDRKTVEDAHLIKVDDPQAVVDQWIAEDPDVKILVLDKGNKLAVYRD